MYALIVTAHAAVGVLALASYWTAGLATKGSRVHRAAGQVFTSTMAFILLTAVVFVGRFVREGIWLQAAFFAYLLLITTSSVLTGWLAVRWKRDAQRYHGTWYHGVAVANLLGGAGILAVGVTAQQTVLAGFSLVGLLRGRQMLRLASRPAAPRWWLREHLGSMIGSGVAVHVAFLLVGLKRVLPKEAYASVELIGWFLPLTLAGVALAYFGRRYAASQPKPV